MWEDDRKFSVLNGTVRRRDEGSLEQFTAGCVPSNPFRQKLKTHSTFRLSFPNAVVPVKLES